MSDESTMQEMLRHLTQTRKLKRAFIKALEREGIYDPKTQATLVAAIGITGMQGMGVPKETALFLVSVAYGDFPKDDSDA